MLSLWLRENPKCLDQWVKLKSSKCERQYLPLNPRTPEPRTSYSSYFVLFIFRTLDISCSRAQTYLYISLLLKYRGRSGHKNNISYSSYFVFFIFRTLHISRAYSISSLMLAIEHLVFNMHIHFHAFSIDYTCN